MVETATAVYQTIVLGGVAAQHQSVSICGNNPRSDTLIEIAHKNLTLKHLTLMMELNSRDSSTLQMQR